MECTERINPFSLLPTETVCHVLGFLRGKDLIATQLTCSLFDGLLNSSAAGLEHLRVRKYPFLISTTSEGTFEKRILRAMKIMIIIGTLLKAGKVWLNKYLLQVNEDIYLYLKDGKLIVMLAHKMQPNGIITTIRDQEFHKDHWMRLVSYGSDIAYYDSMDGTN